VRACDAEEDGLMSIGLVMCVLAGMLIAAMTRSNRQLPKLSRQRNIWNDLNAELMRRRMK
jgi:uncharacterized membrane protein YdcZ (DUF606 family)